VAGHVPRTLPAQQAPRLEHPIDVAVAEPHHRLPLRRLVQQRQASIRRQRQQHRTLDPERAQLQQRLVGILPLEPHRRRRQRQRQRLRLGQPEVGQEVGRRIDAVAVVVADGVQLDDDTLVAQIVTITVELRTRRLVMLRVALDPSDDLPQRHRPRHIQQVAHQIRQALRLGRHKGGR